ncbi:MAG: HAD family hydrolase [Melioribacteraceae bacterium]|nr:HAD family hydrolase [Melioribacteraceae bacterium]
MIKHIIWDWNGTLFNDVEMSVSVMNSILKERKLPILTVEYYRSIFTFPVVDYYKKLNLNFKEEPFEIVGKIFIDRYEERKGESSLHKNVNLLLNELKENSIQQSILSAYSQVTLEEILVYHNIHSYFSNVVGLSHIYADSKIENGKKLMSKLDHNKDEILFIGDTVHDFEVAEELGIKSILFAKGHQSEETLRRTGVPVINEITEMKNYLEI